MSNFMSCSRSRLFRAFTIFSLIIIFSIVGQRRELLNEANTRTANSLTATIKAPSSKSVPRETVIPESILKLGIYDSKDFRNEAGIIPTFWSGCEGNSCNFENVTLNGPCYIDRKSKNWTNEIELSRKQSPRYHETRITARSDVDDLSDYCRPGFIIIGAGKCGTSSLYHYLVEHPRVLPAKEKQIHYFKYYKSYPLKWYYNYFPTATDFLATGSLMTGEASPGYIPYPDVAHRIQSVMPGVRVIALGRDPLSRAYSSYYYNYVTPTINEMKTGKVRDRAIKLNQNDSYYESFLVSFPDMIRAELNNLRSCLEQDGRAEVEALKVNKRYPWLQSEIQRRKIKQLPPMVDVNSCYSKAQWSDFVAQHPDKIVTNSNSHLKESLIGRSLYVLPLDWWYAEVAHGDIYFACTEDLNDMSGEPVNHIGRFLGLPTYNFSSIVRAGLFNVGGRIGYDEETPWDQAQELHLKRAVNETLPEDLRSDLLEFIRPFNERLFELTGRRCEWNSSYLPSG